MVKVDNAWGSKEHAKQVVIIGDMVYLHTDIKQFEDNLYEYVEYQCTLSEFLTAVFALSETDVISLIKKLEVQDQ